MSLSCGILGKSIFFSLLLITFSVNANDLFKKWDISDSRGMKCEVGGTCDIRLEYTVSHLAKYPRYRILRKDCEEDFEHGTHPIRDLNHPVIDTTKKFTAMSISPKSNDHAIMTASAEFVLTIDSSQSWSSWFSDITKKIKNNPNNNDRVVEFCIRMSLWTSSKPDAIEINFRETNVAITLSGTKITDNTRSGQFSVEKVTLYPRPMPGVQVNIMGASANLKEDKKDETRDEL